MLQKSSNVYDSPCLSRTSGAIYSGVPQNVYRFSPGGVLLANPKSDNLGYPFASFHVHRHTPWYQSDLVPVCSGIGRLCASSYLEHFQLLNTGTKVNIFSKNDSYENIFWFYISINYIIFM